MRLIVIMMLATSLHLSANGIAQNKVTLNVNRVRLDKFLHLLESKTSFSFTYSLEKIPVEKLISVQAKDEPLFELLDRTLSPLSLKYQLLNNRLIVVSSKQEQASKLADIDALRADAKTDLANEAEKFRITGRVSDGAGLPLENVSVIETGTSNGTATDNTGTYVIYVSDKNGSLTFSIIGYKERVVKMKPGGILDVALEKNVTENETVVVVGYGTQKKASVVGAISNIDPQKLQFSPTRSVSNGLAGMIPGILAVTRSGDPTNNSSDFWIRGISTFSNNRPLVLVDGIERNINDLDANEIESFSVLKDASASAVYGVRGANGVIMITTKRGRIGSPKVGLRVEGAATSPTKMPEYVGAVKYLEVLNDIYKNSGIAPLFSEEKIENYRNKVDPELYPDIDWWKEVAKNNAGNLRVNASVNGGNNFLRYALQLGYFNEAGIVKRDPKQEWNSSLRLNKYNVRSNVDVNLTKTTLLRVNIGGFLQTQIGPPMSSDFDVFYNASMTPPYVHPPVYSNGKIPMVPNRVNPWALVTQRGFVTTNASKLESLASLEQDITYVPGLKAKFTFSFDKWTTNSVKRTKGGPDYYDPATQRDADGNLILNIRAYGQEFLDYEKTSDWGDQAVYLEGQLNYNRTFFDKHNVGALLLYNQRNYDNGDKLTFRNQGLAGRVSYAYDRKYIAEFNFGYNGSENFAPGKRYGFFPAVAVGWLVSEEKFMENVTDIISTLKIRGSVGKAGNSNIGGRRFAYLSTIENTGSYKFGVNNDYFRQGREEGEIGVPNLTWETVTKSNIGIDLGFFNNVLNLQVDFFEEKRKDIFIQRTNIPGSAGFSRTVWANYGKVNNKGIDMSLNGNKQFSKDFSMTVMANFTYAHNTVIEKDEPLNVKGTSRSLEGKPIGQHVGYIALGLFTDEDFETGGSLKADIAKQTWNNKILPGDIKYKDLNEDGVINDLDRTSIGGTWDPQVVYGFGLTAKYKSFDFGFFFQGTGNTYQVLGGEEWLPGASSGLRGNMLSNIDDRWTSDNPRQDVFWPRLTNYINENNKQASTWWLKKMNFLRLRNVELGYSLPDRISKKAAMSNCRFFVRASNILTFSPFKLWDPELGTTDGLKYPTMRTVSAGLSINFL